MKVHIISHFIHNKILDKSNENLNLEVFISERTKEQVLIPRI
jgi:hypothetical protein